MPHSEYDALMSTWEQEASKTVALLKALPRDKYDFRPDAGGRSLGELAWHLAEGDAYMTFGLEQGGVKMDAKPPGIERPRKIEELAPGYERIHKEAVARIQKLGPEVLEKKVEFFMPGDWTGSAILWRAMLYHHIHHRGQLALMCRIAGGCSPGMYGPNREESAAMRAQMQQK